MAKHSECPSNAPHGPHRMDVGYHETYSVHCDGVPTEAEVNRARRAAELQEAKAQVKHARQLALVQAKHERKLARIRKKTRSA